VSNLPSHPSDSDTVPTTYVGPEAGVVLTPHIPGVDLIRPIGKGAYGEVWIGRNPVNNRLIAVKLIRLTSKTGESCASRELSALRREASHRNRNPHLVDILHVGQTAQYLYYFMELADAVDEQAPSSTPAYQPLTLAVLLHQKQIPTSDCLRIGTQLLEGLSALHQSGLTHRDVKPSNCLFVDGHLKLADYGLLAHSDSSSSIIGTPKYMPPDQKMDPQADVYAAGLVIYEMLTGMPAEEFPSWPRQRLKEIQSPTGLAMNQVMLKACERDPSKRYPNATEMLSAIRSHLDPKPESNFSRRHGLLWGLTLLLIIAALAIISLGSSRTVKVAVNFITRPFEAEIYLDGKRLMTANDEPYRTPCTVLGIPAVPMRVVFKKSGLDDLDIGTVDFNYQRAVEVEFP